MSGLRKIVINGCEYLWKYVFDDYDYHGDSYILIKSIDKNGKLIISFCVGPSDYGYCPFNKGVEAIYRGERIIINLNQPRFIAETVKFVFENLNVDKLVGTISLDNGIEIIHKLGYEFEYSKSF